MKAGKAAIPITGARNIDIMQCIATADLADDGNTVPVETQIVPVSPHGCVYLDGKTPEFHHIL
jgi:hypothetical protein